MFEVFNSVQIKPFSLIIGIMNKKSFFQSLRISCVMPRFAAFCKTYHKTAKLIKQYPARKETTNMFSEPFLGSERWQIRISQFKYEKIYVSEKIL